MDGLLKRVRDQLQENKAVFDIALALDETLEGVALDRADRVRIEAIYMSNVVLIADLDKLASVLRGMK